MKKILVVTSSIDATASYVINSSNADFFRLNVDQFSSYEVSVENNGWHIVGDHEIMHDTDVTSIYYRKPMLPDVSTYQEQYRGMIERDIVALINGIVDSFNGIVLSKPSILRKSENKAFQLLYAAQHGFTLPQSYIGNSCGALKKFSERESIIKPLSTGKTKGESGWEIYQTSLLRPVDIDISLTPVYLQNYVPKQYEVRMTVVNESVYPVRIDTLNQIDWRADYENHKYQLIECPDDVKEKCFRMLRDFNLKFGAFDFIVTPENEWVFLEVNPNGQWLWLEEALDLDISQKIVGVLKESM